MRHILQLFLIAIAIVIASSSDARSQIFIPFHVQDGYSAALDKARDTLAADAYLVYAGTFGDLDLSDFGLPLTLNFYLENETVAKAGQADAWGYVFASPSTGTTMSLVVLRIPFGGFIVQGVPVDLPLPSQLVDTLALTIAGTRGDSTMARLNRDDIYVEYHDRYPEKQPNFITLGVALPDEIDPPNGFELGGPIWSLTFRGGGDTASMICLVSAESGATVCRTAGTSSAPSDAAIASTTTLRVIPTPASTHVRIVVDNPAAIRGDVGMELLDASGRRVVDLAASLAANGFAHAELDATSLASGVYFCRLTVGGRSSVVAIPIVHD
jgi:hypothetical protein